MRVAHPTDEALPLALRHREDESRGILRRLARGEHHLGNATPQEAPQVEARPPAQLVELHAPQLRQGILFAQLSGDELAQHIPHRPSNTSRMRCQCVPAQ